MLAGRVSKLKCFLIAECVTMGKYTWQFCSLSYDTWMLSSIGSRIPTNLAVVTASSGVPSTRPNVEKARSVVFLLRLDFRTLLHLMSLVFAKV